MQVNMLKITIKVVPASGMKKFVLDKSGQLKCFLKSPPQDGAANAELIKMLAKALELPQDTMKIIMGATSRKKIIAIQTDLSYESCLERLGCEAQHALF